jgi:NAD(P)-dependent dehydrogenase (short-subunit alcohol dehydrogenase family)
LLVLTAVERRGRRPRPLTFRLWGALAAAKYGWFTLTSGMLAHRPMKAAAIGGAVELLTRGLAVDLVPVRVNAVCPGIIRTKHTEQTKPAERLQAFVAPLPLSRAGSPADAVQAYVYLMLNADACHILPVDDGGLLV